MVAELDMSSADYKPVEIAPKAKDPADPINYSHDADNRSPWGPYVKKKAYGQVTIRFPINPHPLNLIALAYGFLPWLLPILLTVHGIATWHFLPLYGVAMSIVCALINEAVLKPILKQPRPQETAHVYTHGDKIGQPKDGMPSGHVLNATTLMVWSLLEVGLKGPGLEKDQALTITWLIIILVLMAPVPWARWHNWDHTLNQTLVSLCLGTIVGAAAFYLRVTYFSQPWKPWADTDTPAMAKVTAWRPAWAELSTTEAPADNRLLLL